MALKILVSNDDGIHAEGINTLAEYLSQKYDVYVVAPDRERSAMGHALTLHKPIRVEEVDVEYPAKAAYSITGTPSDCVKIAINALLDFRPDLVVSGINHGPNLGFDVLYSGTVSAALEGMMNGVHSIAVSLSNGYDKHADFTAGAHFIRDFIPKALEEDIPAKTILNINVPGVGLNEISGIRVTELGTRMYSDQYEKRVDPRNQVYYWLAGEVLQVEEADTTDIQAIRDNMISVTPVQVDLTHHSVLDACKEDFEYTGNVSEYLRDVD